MFHYPRYLFQSINMHRSVQPHLIKLVRKLFVGIAVIDFVGCLLWLIVAPSWADSVRPLSIGLLIGVVMLVALIVLQRGKLETAVLVATTGLILALWYNYNGLGIYYGVGLLSTLLLPIALAGFMTSRIGLIFTIGLSLALISVTSYLDHAAPQLTGFAAPHGLQSNATIIAFALVAGLLGFCIDQFSSALRRAFAEVLAREQELQRIRESLEARTDELSRAKEALESELISRAQAQAELAQERDLLHALMDNIPDTIYFKDTESRFTRINRAQVQLLGVNDTNEAVGKTDFDFFNYPELAQSFYNDERKLFETEQPLVDRIECHPSASGTPRWFSATKVPLRNAQGQVFGLIGISRDITARKEVERLKTEFISTVSHELRTPLTSIHGSLGLLSGGVAGPISPVAQSMLDIAYKNSSRLTRLVNDILDLQQIESGKLSVQLAPIDLIWLLEHTIECNAAYADQHQISFALCEVTPEAMVYSDSDRLIQVFTNLLSNAAKFAPAHSAVEIRVRRQRQNLRIAVTDHGPGIPKAFQSQIFGKFAQADGSDARQKSGSGLGLSITKALVDRLGGHIWFTSEAGQGTTFYVELAEWN